MVETGSANGVRAREKGFHIIGRFPGRLASHSPDMGAIDVTNDGVWLREHLGQQNIYLVPGGDYTAFSSTLNLVYML